MQRPERSALTEHEERTREIGVLQALGGSPYEEDTAAFRRSGPGRAILAGGEAALPRFGPDERAVLRRLLKGVMQGTGPEVTPTRWWLAAWG